MVIIILAEKKVKKDMCILGQSLYQHILYEEVDRARTIKQEIVWTGSWEGERERGS